MKLHPTLDPKPEILHGFIVEIRFLAATNTRQARIKAVCDTGCNGNQVSITEILNYGDTTNQIKDLVVKLVEKHDLNFLRNSVGKMSMATFRKGWIVSMPV